MKKGMLKKQLFLWVFIGFALGILLGAAAPGFSLRIKFIGDLYLNLIRMMIVPILICAVGTGIANLQDSGALRRIGLKTVGLFIVMFVCSAAVSFAVAYLIRPGRGLQLAAPPVWEGTLADTSLEGFFSMVIPSNIFQSLANGDILPIIIFTALCAVAIVKVGEPAAPVLKLLNSLNTVLFKVLGYVMWVTPLGVLALMAHSTAVYGVGIFSALGKYILCCYAACIATFLVVMLLPLRVYTGMKAGQLFRGLYKVLLMTVSTTSSSATLPTTLRVSIEEFHAPEDMSNFVLPLGCTINMCGGACSFCCLALFVSDFYGMQLSFATMAQMVVIATLLNMAAPGIPGGGIVLGASFLSVFGLPIDLMGPIAAIYRLLDMAFTSMNVSGDVMANLLLAKSEGRWNAKMAYAAETSPGETPPAPKTSQ